MHEQRAFFVYMLMNRKGTLYTGVTNNLEFGLVQHRSGTGTASSPGGTMSTGWCGMTLRPM